MKNKQNPNKHTKKVVGGESHISSNAKQNGQPLLFTVQIHNPTPTTYYSPGKKKTQVLKKKKSTKIKAKNGTNLSQLSIDIVAIIVVMIIILIYCLPL